VGSRCFVKTNCTSRAHRRQCNTREQCHRWQLLYRSTETKDRPLTGEGLPTVGGYLSEPGEEGVKARLNQPLGTSLPGLTIRREMKREGRWLHSDRGNVACLRRGGWIEVTMISRGVEISIAGGIAVTEDANYCDPVFSLYRLFTPTTLTLVTHNLSHAVL